MNTHMSKRQRRIGYDDSSREIQIKIRPYLFYACLIGLGANLIFVLCQFSLYRVFQCLLWLVGAYALKSGGTKLYELLQYFWGMLIGIQIIEIYLYATDLYGWIETILTLLSALLMVIFWTQKRMNCSHKSILYIGLAAYVLREIMITIGLTEMLVQWLPGYLIPSFSISCTYTGILADVMFGIVTWMQRDQ